LAERWGRVTPDGVLLPLTLSHRMLGQLIGARRPTVSTALGALTRAGEVSRRMDGGWLLCGSPRRGGPSARGIKYLPAKPRWANRRGTVKNFGRGTGSETEIAVKPARAGRSGPNPPATSGEAVRFIAPNQAGRLPLRVGSRPAFKFRTTAAREWP
jgi:hypothetical protein